MKWPRKQRGMTAIGILAILILVGGYVYVGMKLFPIYMSNYGVRSVISSLETEPMLAQKGIREIRTLIKRRLKINNVRTVKPENIKITKTGGKLTVDITYIVQEPIVGNIDVLISFSEQAEVTAH